tara:strand:- start:449 stop:874 length:426 start_codon:yes stop_codon:yes gene_type:complete
MNKKREVDDVLESIFNLIQDAHEELKEPKQNDQNHNKLIIEKEKSINTHKSLINEKILSNSKSRDGDWSNLNFKKIEFVEDKNTTHNDESTKIKTKHWLSDNYIKKVFFDSLENWKKKNLKNLTENIYQEIIKENLKKKLK